MRFVIALTVFCGLWVPGTRVLAGPTNPDLSVIGDTRAFWSEATNKTELEFHELEIALVGPLNPYASAAVFVAFHGLDVVEVEEAKLMLDRYFPAGFGLTIGHYFQDFGQINPVHSHAYPQVFRPLMHEAFFGPDGAVDTGVRLDWIAPVDAVTVRATAGAIRGQSLLGAHEHDEETATHTEHEETADPELGASGRVSIFVEPSQNISFLFGSSILHGQHDPAEGARVTWLDLDVKAYWDLGPSRALVISAEGVLGSLEATAETNAFDPQGWFAGADLRFNRKWNAGAFAEATTGRFTSTRTDRFGGFAGLALMEETTLFRLVVHRTHLQGSGSDTGVLLQALFALGPHRPHRY